MPLWPKLKTVTLIEPAHKMFINRRNPLRLNKPAERACLPLQYQPETCDADDEDRASDATCEHPDCLHNARFIFCDNPECLCVLPKEHDHYCGDADCRRTHKRSAEAAMTVHFPRRPDGILKSRIHPAPTSYHSAVPKFRTSPSTTIVGKHSRLSDPQVIIDYSPAILPPPSPGMLPHQRLVLWNTQRSQRELDAASIVVGPPTDVDDWDDCWLPSPHRDDDVSTYRRYINARNPVMKHVFDIENRVPVSPVVDTDDAACIESTESDTGSDATYSTALPPLNSSFDPLPPLDSSGSSPADSVLVTPEEREVVHAFFLLRPEDSVDSEAEAEGSVAFVRLRAKKDWNIRRGYFNLA
ncbi:hypothetical protein QFC20_005802 [Naganishia adeliensis]|uniref:Uncharacterized protein n=1 Tax=Naganishia adeliensis TaxID=92952 RepID=A0ACC2VJ17_9TREE|nr:hypothetical protein QFC20_005802 [Naganishia adeliensis]